MNTSERQMLARYRQLRIASKRLHHELIERLPDDALQECSRLLGVNRDGVLVLNSENESTVIMDYCIYDWRPDGLNAVERYVAEVQVEPGSDEKVLLDAMLRARYSLFAVDGVIAGLGVETHDLLRGDGGFIMDVGLSETAVEGLVLAGRLITPEGCPFSMTTGAALPVDQSALNRIKSAIKKHMGDTTVDMISTSPAKAAELSAFLVRLLLRSGASSHMKYEDNLEEEKPKTIPKVGRNDPCPCGSGKKYKRCCGRLGETGTLPDRRLMERDLRGVQRLLEGKDFGSIDEINAYLRGLTAEGKLPEWAPQTAMDRAQELVYQAVEAKGKKERVRLAIEAINVCKDCADAYVLLAEEAETLEEAVDRYRQGVEAGERALGPDAFTENVGHFWGLVETRPYMRARQGLADCLLLLGQWDAAMAHYREMLRLNPNDNQGIRYRLLSGLLGSNDIVGAEDLLDQFKDEASAAWLFTEVLVSFVRRGDTASARRRIREAMKQNPHVVAYLLGQRRMPRALPEMIGWGDRNEAVAYVAEFAGAWRDTPGAMEWLRAASRST